MGANVVVVATGSEITNGKSIDTNSGWIANELSGLGFKVLQIIALPDAPDYIQSQLESLISNDQVNWIIMTGGLGPTADDYTVDVILKMSGEDAFYVEKARLRLEAIYKKRGFDYESILHLVNRQTRVPTNSIVLDNKVGIAPGFIMELGNNTKIACMPGVPPEMKEMFTRKLVPKLLESTGRSLLCRGERYIWNIGESLFQEEFITSNPLIDDSVEWGVTAKRGFIKATFLSSDSNRISAILEQLDSKYSGKISGDAHNDLHNLLIENKETIAVAESCTGGWVSKLLTDRPGSSAYFIASLVTYHNLAKENLLFVKNGTLTSKGAVSEETCKEMLVGLEKHFHVDYCLSITGIAGPGGGTDDKPIGTVYIGVKKKGSSPKIYRYYFPGNREIVREATANNALFLLYKEVMNA